MEELSGGGSRKSSRGADEREEKVTAEGVRRKGDCRRSGAEEKVAAERVGQRKGGCDKDR